MLNQLIEILRASGADAWEVTDERKTGWEFYFIRHKLDQNRFTDVEEYTVKVYRKIDDGKFLGSAQASVSTTASADEIRRVVAGLCQDALYVRNPAYTLNRPVFQPPVPETPVDIKAISRDFLNTLASLPETATEDLNSYEIFVSEVRTRFLNSEGIDVTSVSPSSVVEAVVNARRDGHEIELYRFYRSGACDAEQLTHDLSETLRYGRDKLIAGETPALGTADVVLSTDAATSVYEYFISRLSTAAVYRRISSWEIVAVQEHDPLAACGRQRDVPGGGKPRVFLVHIDDAGILRRVFLAYARVAFGPAVIDQQDLDLPVCLREQAVQAAREVLFDVPDRNDDRDQTGHAFLCRYHLQRSAIFRATYTPLADACDSECVTPLPSPMTYRPLCAVSRFSSIATSML